MTRQLNSYQDKKKRENSDHDQGLFLHLLNKDTIELIIMKESSWTEILMDCNNFDNSYFFWTCFSLLCYIFQCYEKYPSCCCCCWLIKSIFLWIWQTTMSSFKLDSIFSSSFLQEGKKECPYAPWMWKLSWITEALFFWASRFL